MIYGVLDAAFIYFAVLLVASLSGLISEKAGIINIGINGMMIIGALVFRITGNLVEGYNHKWTIIIALIMAGIITSLFALLHGVATIVFKANHVVSGTAINLLAGGIALYLTPLLASKIAVSRSNSFEEVYIFVGLGKTIITPQSITYCLIGLAIAITMLIYFKHTVAGLRHISVGENPDAANSVAIKVLKYKWLAVLVSGFLAGLAGAMALAKFGEFAGNVQGLGFVALAIMILGQWRIPIMASAAFGFAFLWGYLTRNKTLFGLPENFVKMIPFILSLASLAFLSKYQSAPKAVGKHYEKIKK